MQSSIRFVISLVLLSSVLASSHSNTKLRRDGVLNLYPFPRVGRASRNTWQIPFNDFFLGKGIDYEPVEKRQLYAFPRVGRSEISALRGQALRGHLEYKPDQARSLAEVPMWFGPRIGRSFKSSDNDITIHNDHSEPEQMESIHEDRENREDN